MKARAMNSKIDYALRYLRAGLAPIPVWPDKRKNPKLKDFGQYTRRFPSQAEIKYWWSKWPEANIGLITGYWGNYVALDFDDDFTYRKWGYRAGYYAIGKTWTVQTSRGFHVWFRLEDDPGRSRIYTCDGCEILLRAKGGYCISPPSIHHSGTQYRTLHNNPVSTISDLSIILSGWVEKSDKKPDGGQIKSAATPTGTRIEELIAPIGKPNARGAYQVFCPFHQDENPSAWLNIHEQRFGCNACFPGKWFDTVNVISMLRGISNGEAYKILKGEK